MLQTTIDTTLRHELKHFITASDMAQIIARLSVIARPDDHHGDAPYRVRSLYFDNVYDKALCERMNGMEVREKFRIRYYNGNTDFIKLEKKEKLRDLCGKRSCTVTREQAQRLIDGDSAWLASSPEPLCVELYARMQGQLLRPRTIVEYTRRAYVYDMGNVRITLDYDVRTGLDCIRIFDDPVLIPADLARPIIMEVKYDSYLPGIIRDAIQLHDRRAESYSKYAACRQISY